MSHLPCTHDLCGIYNRVLVTSRSSWIRSNQLPCTLVTSFSQTSLFLEWVWRKFRISVESHKRLSETYRPGNGLFCFNDLQFSSFISYTLNGHLDGVELPFCGKKCSKMCLKTNQFLKMPCHRPSMGVALSWLWAPVTTQYVKWNILYLVQCGVYMYVILSSYVTTTFGLCIARVFSFLAEQRLALLLPTFCPHVTFAWCCSYSFCNNLICPIRPSTISH